MNENTIEQIINRQLQRARLTYFYEVLDIATYSNNPQRENFRLF
jgi:hypothetical protein